MFNEFPCTPAKEEAEGEEEVLTPARLPAVGVVGRGRLVAMRPRWRVWRAWGERRRVGEEGGWEVAA